MTFTMSDCPSFRKHVHADSVTEDHTLNDIDLLDLFLNHTQPVFIVGDFFLTSPGNSNKMHVSVSLIVPRRTMLYLKKGLLQTAAFTHTPSPPPPPVP